jgi:hypothetical protein
VVAGSPNRSGTARRRHDRDRGETARCHGSSRGRDRGRRAVQACRRVIPLAGVLASDPCG